MPGDKENRFGCTWRTFTLGSLESHPNDNSMIRKEASCPLYHQWVVVRLRNDHEQVPRAASCRLLCRMIDRALLRRISCALANFTVWVKNSLSYDVIDVLAGGDGR